MGSSCTYYESVWSSLAARQDSCPLSLGAFPTSLCCLSMNQRQLSFPLVLYVTVAEKPTIWKASRPWRHFSFQGPEKLTISLPPYEIQMYQQMYLLVSHPHAYIDVIILDVFVHVQLQLPCLKSSEWQIFVWKTWMMRIWKMMTWMMKTYW